VSCAGPCKIDCRTYVLSEALPSLPRVRSRNETSKCIGQRILGAIDLAIDIATLGEYGLEPLPANAGGLADGPCRERPGHQTGWEAFAKARRGDCGAGGARTTESRPEAAL
jgi:hypothetical protein